MRKYITFKQAAVLAAAVFISLTAQRASHRALADADDELSKERQEAREWYQDAKFGAFVTWGIYSLMGGATKQFLPPCVVCFFSK